MTKPKKSKPLKHSAELIEDMVENIAEHLTEAQLVNLSGTLQLELYSRYGIIMTVEPLDEPEPRRTKKKTKSKKTL